VRPHDQALRQDRPGPDVHLTEDHRGAGDLGLGLVNEHLVEAHGVLTVLLAVRASGRLGTDTTPALAARLSGSALRDQRADDR
jgi:hypothetical protein